MKPKKNSKFFIYLIIIRNLKKKKKKSHVDITIFLLNIFYILNKEFIVFKHAYEIGNEISIKIELNLRYYHSKGIILSFNRLK